ncbi:MAG TPA: hypothetical protein VGK31_05310 [Thermoanaerobaculia bacterium]
MRTTIAILSILSALALSAATPDPAGLTAEALLQRGVASYRAAHYSDAASDLTAAAQAFLAPEQMQNYVNTGKFQNLGQFETALVYLTLAQTKLGHEDLAREAVLRLMTAERIESLYAQLPLDPDTAEFEVVAAKLVPGSTLPANVRLARGGAAPATTLPAAVAQAAPPPPPAPTETAAAPTPAPTTTVAEATPAQPQTSSVPSPAPPPPPQPAPVQTAQTTTGEKLVVQPTLASERAERQRIIDELVAQERVKIQKAADERIAAERVAAQKAADERAEARIVAERTATQKAADERIAAERASIQRAADERIAAAQKAAEAQIAALQAQNRRNYLVSLRQADAYAATDKTDQANQIYTAIVSSQDAPREIVAEAAIGLYRTGAFRSAANAFKKLAPYSRGEEDLRYYNAVSLYETGHYAEAKKELACALPFIQVTDDVSRYQTKIEKTASQQAMR